jgi:hypothetical protein
VKSLLERLRAPVAALPHDIFRILVGLLGVAYFVRLLLEVPDTMAAGGLLDHDLIARIDPHTRLSLFQPGIPDVTFYLALGVGLMCMLAVLVGWRPRVCAFVAWLIAVSAARWFFLVLHLDDTIPEQFMFWLVLLPVGHTLTVSERASPTDRWERWCSAEVNGTALRCFIGNLLLLYLVAGLTKATSPMWRDGFGLYASLKLQLSRCSPWWNSHHLWFLRVGDYLTMLFEPTVFPVLLLLRPGSRGRYICLSFLIGFHLSIAYLMGIVYANVALLLGEVLVFHREIADLARRCSPRLQTASTQPQAPAPRVLALDGVRTCVASPPAAWSDAVAIVFVCLLALCQSAEVPLVGSGYQAGYALLYIMGTQQDYHLFNWIEQYNWAVTDEVKVTSDGRTRDLAAEEFIPPGTRFNLMRTYLHHMKWTALPWGTEGEVRRSLLQRFAQRFARRHRDESGQCDVYCTEQRITRDNADLTHGERRLLVSFRFGQGVATCLEPY